MDKNEIWKITMDCEYIWFRKEAVVVYFKVEF
jgi:hypothetical protein